MTPLGAYACCCTAVRGAALRVAASHTITHSQCEQQQGKARPPPLSRRMPVSPLPPLIPA